MKLKTVILAMMVSFLVIVVGIVILKATQDSYAPITETFSITNHTTPQAFITKQLIDKVQSLQLYNNSTAQWHNISFSNLYIRYGYFIVDAPLLTDTNFTMLKIIYRPMYDATMNIGGQNAT